MKKILNFVTLLVFLGALAFAVVALEKFAAQDISGPFEVVDGDSLRVDAADFRLRGIDAPEYRQICSNAQGYDYRCGIVARDRLRQLISARNPVCRGFDTDRYGRLLVDCRAGAGERDINATLVREGLAVAYGDFFDEQAQAKANRLGLWAGQFELPRDYRRTKVRRGDIGYRDVFGLRVLVSHLRQWAGLLRHGQ